MTFEAAVEHWTDTINRWYNVQATVDEVKQSFNDTLCDQSEFLVRDGVWCEYLDTADRETLLNGVLALRQRAFVEASTVLTISVPFRILSEAHATEDEIRKVLLGNMIEGWSDPDNENWRFAVSDRGEQIKFALLEALKPKAQNP